MVQDTVAGHSNLDAFYSIHDIIVCKRQRAVQCQLIVNVQLTTQPFSESILYEWVSSIHDTDTHVAVCQVL